MDLATLAGAAVAGLALGLRAALRRVRRQKAERQQAAREAQPEIRRELAQALGCEPARLPPLGGWALAPDTALHLVRLVLERRPSRVLELGSGSSTVILAQALRRAGGGALASLEHDPAWAQRTRALLAEAGLRDAASVAHAPLRRVSFPDEGGLVEMRWYDADVVARLAAQAGGTWDLLLVDGPPATRDDQARWPALPLLLPRLSPSCAILLDDADRPGERALLERWRAAGLLAGFDVARLAAVRGAVLLTRPAAARR
jgi:predicted O-methyltransferase YrrM